MQMNEQIFYCDTTIHRYKLYWLNEKRCNNILTFASNGKTYKLECIAMRISRLKLKAESKMEVFTKLFVFFLIAVGIQNTEACVRNNCNFSEF